MKILLVEDEEKLANSLGDFLRRNDFIVDIELDGSLALKALSNHDYEAIVLDWLLPGIEGIDIARILRERNDLTPILMLTAQSGLQHRIQGIETGADDYVTKPFHPEEVLVRLRSLIRRSQQLPVNIYRSGEFSFTVADKTVHHGEQSIELSQKESDILTILFQNQGSVVDRKTFLQQVWGYDFDPNTNAVEVYIKMLRTKLSLLADVELIKTKRGAGYFLEKES